MISLWGEKIFIPQIQLILQQQLGFPISLRVVDRGVSLNEDPQINREQHTLHFEIFGDGLDTEEKRLNAQAVLLTVLNETYYSLPELLEAQKLILTTTASQTSPDDLIKSWKIQRPERES